MIRIENWFIGSPHPGDGFTAPELLPRSLCGEVYGHPRFQDGHVITTSSLVKLDLKAKTAETYSGSKYALGTPDADYVKWCDAQGHSVPR